EGGGGKAVAGGGIGSGKHRLARRHCPRRLSSETCTGRIRWHREKRSEIDARGPSERAPSGLVRVGPATSTATEAFGRAEARGLARIASANRPPGAASAIPTVGARAAGHPARGTVRPWQCIVLVAFPTIAPLQHTPSVAKGSQAGESRTLADEAAVIRGRCRRSGPSPQNQE